jgi:penicillin-binding protein 2
MGRGPSLTPRLAKRIAVLGGIVMVLFGVLVVRLWFLQVVGSKGFEAQAAGNRLRTIEIPAPRGDIVDRNGRVLATSRLGYDIVALPGELVGADNRLTPKARATLRRLGQAIGAPPRRLDAKVVRGAETPFESVVLESDISDGIRVPLSERLREFPGIAIQQSYQRYYPHGSLAAHVLGYVGAISPAELKGYRAKGYVGNEVVGKAGLEARYEEYLRGTPGRRQVEIDAFGDPVGPVTETPPQPGRELRTSLDIKIQKTLENAIRTQVELKSEQGGGGGGVVMDPRNGEVLALASYPTFDPNDFVRARTRKIRIYFSHPRRPLYDRVIASGANGYPAGSTFKPLTAIAALNTGYLRTDEYLSSPSVVKLFGTPFRNFRSQSQPDLQVRRALAVSSDTFFYQVGAKIYSGAPKADRPLGHNALEAWAERFGLGRPTGVDLPGEASGTVPDLAWKEKHLPKSYPYRDVWLPGDTINMSVGQGLVQVTPIQMARAYAALVNGGRVLTPTIGREVLDQNSNERISNLERGRPETHLPPMNSGVLSAVLGGLYDVANTGEGTAAGVFSPLGSQVRVAGKTGTAENLPYRDHSWFVGYAPADDPRVVAAVIIERAGLGVGAAAPAVCAAMSAALTFDAHACGSVVSSRAN